MRPPVRNFKVIIHILSALLLFLAVSLLFPAGVAAVYGEGDLPAFLITIGITTLIGLPVFFLTRARFELRARDGFVIVTLAWVCFSLLGALPFYLSGGIPSYSDAFFETMSGFTTTGASILTDIEALPHGLLFWRSFTHWLGGMGIILLSLAILPLLGVGGMQLYKAEVPGPAPDKLSPRIQQTAKLLWGVYLLLTVLEVVLLKLAGMNLFDALCHTFGTVATGGFSTKNTSIGYYDSALIDGIITVFMILAGVNFTLHFLALRGKVRYWSNTEFRVFVGLIAFASLLIGMDVWSRNGNDIFRAAQHAIFTVVSILTTTGYGTADYELWSGTSQLILFFLMFSGGSAGSTSGGIKLIRILILTKFGRSELRRLLHPQAVLPIRIDGKAIDPEIVGNVAGFFVIYMMLFITGVLFMSGFGVSLETAFGAVVAMMSNIGPGLGEVGPTDNFGFVPAAGKWFLSFLMLVGRLEIYTVIVLFGRTFWKT